MNFLKGADKQVDQAIDKAAGMAKEKVGAMIGGDKKKPGDAKAPKIEGGIGDMASGAVGKATSDAAADEALDFAKGLIK